MAAPTLMNWIYNADGRLCLFNRLAAKGCSASSIEAVCERDTSSTNDLENVFSAIAQLLHYKAPIYKHMDAARQMDRLAYLRTHAGDYGIVSRISRKAKYEQQQMAEVRGRWWNSAAAVRCQISNAARGSKMRRIQHGATKACTLTARLFNKLKKGTLSIAG